MKNQIYLLIGVVLLIHLELLSLKAQIPTSETFSIPTSRGNVQVKNFYKTSTLFTDSGAVELQDGEYQIAFDGLNYHNFFIHLPLFPANGKVTKNWDFLRGEAENSFVKLLGIAKDDACKLKVNLGFAGIHNELASTYAGINFGLSFCPGSLPIPPLDPTPEKGEMSDRRRAGLATRNWQPYWVKFSAAVNRKDFKTLGRLACTEFFDGGGGGTAMEWFDMMSPHWNRVKMMVRSGTKSLKMDERKQIERMTKYGDMIFKFDDDNRWCFSQIMGD